MRAVLRRTKIVATLGPATESDAAIDSLIKAGVDVVRLNFSHGTPAEHQARAEKIRRIGIENNRHLAILADLQGPKIRLEKFKNGQVDLAVGEKFCLNAECPDGEGDSKQIGLTYKLLPQDVKNEDILVLDDGRIVLQVDSVDGPRINCTVQVGGVLSDNKGINLKGGGLTAEVLTDKDRADLKTAAMIDADYLAVSFPRNAADMIQARKLLDAEGSSAGLIAKIERAEALDNL
ncbi:MAG: pyruvate kinase, partial [Gammaproteobacteria bacterium]|nr:pyruvate kinase [Gammaproteobacteria bacterium]